MKGSKLMKGEHFSNCVIGLSVNVNKVIFRIFQKKEGSKVEFPLPFLEEISDN